MPGLLPCRGHGLLRVERCAERSRHPEQGHEDQSSPKGYTLEKLNDRFQHLLPDPHNQIPRPFYHRIHNGAFTLSCPLEIKGGELADFPWDTAAHPGTVEQGDYHVGIIEMGFAAEEDFGGFKNLLLFIGPFF